MSSSTFGNSAMDATTELTWNFADRPVVPNGLFQYMTNLQHVAFLSNVTSIEQKAFLKLPPKARVDFYGPDMPALGSQALYRDGEADDTRIVIVVHDRAALLAWKEATAENADVFRTEFRRQKPDYPGAGTICLLKLGTKTVGKATVGIYAWVKLEKPDGLMILLK